MESKPKPPCMIIAETQVEGQETTFMLLDHNQERHRKWLGKHCWWAVRSGAYVAMYPVGLASQSTIEAARVYA